MRTKGALDQALEENAKLLRSYKAANKQRLSGLCADPAFGGKLHRFIATLHHFGPEHGDRFVEYVEEACRKWLRKAPIDIRFAALSACNERCMKIRERLGLVPIDDSLPGEPDCVFVLCRKAIGVK
jgi:hypothetical protein